MIKLKRLQYDDIHMIEKWYHDESIYRNIFIEDWKSYFHYAQKNENTYLYEIYMKELFVGEITLEKEDDHVNISILIDPKRQGEGIGKNALYYVINHIENLVLFKPSYLYAGIDPNNKASIKLFENSGYQNHGVGKDGELNYLYYFTPNEKDRNF